MMKYISCPHKTNIYFKNWSRKKYAVFASLKKIIKICTLLYTYSLLVKHSSLNAQSDTLFINNNVEIEEVEVIGQRGPGVYSDIARIVTVISKEDIECAPVQSIQELLEYSLNVDVRQRGIYGVQSDISIRGGTFDHVLILLNGINITDPQTGHFNLEFPFDLENVEKIEVLNGPGARIYGSNAFTGAINIITKKGCEKNISVSSAVGQYGYKKWGISFGTPLGKTSHQLSYSGSISNGYAHNTDFNLNNLYYSGSIAAENSLFEFQFGFNKKEFGANAFYSPKFPDQYEEGNVFFSSLKYSTGKKVKFCPQFYWRRKTDHFILIKQQPAIYQNFHLSDVFGSQFNAVIKSKFGQSAIGVDIRSENILSNNLGYEIAKPVPVNGEDSIYYDHKFSRSIINLFWEQNFQAGKFYFSGGSMFNWTNDYPNKPAFYPGIDVSYKVFRLLKIFMSYNRSVHLPTFTDLFYTDPTNQGNINLNPNILNSFESGIKLDNNTFYGQIAYFYIKGKDIIDWLWSKSTNKFQPVNINKFSSQGIEVSLRLKFTNNWTKFQLENFEINYALTDINKSVPDSLSKYYNLKHKLNINIRNRITGKIYTNCIISYQERTGEYITYNEESSEYLSNLFYPFWLLDGRIFWQNQHLTIFLEASNILNNKYIDTGSLIQPGRWVRGGFKLSF